MALLNGQQDEKLIRGFCYDFEFVPVAIELYKLITPYLQPVGYRHMWFNRSEIKPVGNNLKRSTMNFTFGFEIWFKVTAQH